MTRTASEALAAALMEGNGVRTVSQETERLLAALAASGFTLVSQESLARATVTFEQVSDALNSELDDTDGGNDLVAAVLDRLAALREEGT